MAAYATFYLHSGAPPLAPGRVAVEEALKAEPFDKLDHRSLQKVRRDYLSQSDVVMIIVIVSVGLVVISALSAYLIYRRKVRLSRSGKENDDNQLQAENGRATQTTQPTSWEVELQKWQNNRNDTKTSTTNSSTISPCSKPCCHSDETLQANSDDDTITDPKIIDQDDTNDPDIFIVGSDDDADDEDDGDDNNDHNDKDQSTNGSTNGSTDGDNEEYEIETQSSVVADISMATTIQIINVRDTPKPIETGEEEPFEAIPV
ncbi:hypothetical protein F4677DRAFT_464433 [Hypoxylon crocopeplum]|nr:hypothetical protein F4677DRAFT_464433 [Hypoxylon crocopeplum]